MRKKVALFLVAAFAAAFLASPGFAAKPGGGRSGSTIIARI